MASISLALGMTEVINQKNAALDSLFIDEGFGSLDKNSLDMAVNVLQSVGADKTVGLISHVEELKAAIASRVEIVKKPEGSEILVYG
jgi:exonuclease SbcC